MKRSGILRLVVVSSLCLGLGIAVFAQEPKQAQTLQTAKILVTAKGFEPASISLPPNVPAQITFLRQVNETCATSVVMPDYKIDKALPLNQPVVIELTPKTGEIAFTCGMKMYRGKIVAKEQ